MSSPRRDSYGYGSEPASPSAPSASPSPSGFGSVTASRSSGSTPRSEAAPVVPQTQRRLSPRRRTSALVSSIDDVLASMEAHGTESSKKDSSGRQMDSLSTFHSLVCTFHALCNFVSFSYVLDTKAPKYTQIKPKQLSRPKSPFERTRSSSSTYSSEEERLFVENLVELVGESSFTLELFFIIALDKSITN